jgi:putative ABC transport system permease protein
VSSWHPALLIAWRTLLRSPGRSSLIAILVGLPVAAATYADVIPHTFGSPQLRAQQMVGSADGSITVTPQTRLPGYDPRWLAEHSTEPSRQSQRDPVHVDVAALLPRGSRLAPMPRYQPVGLRVGQAVVRTRILLADVRQPLQRFVLRLEGPGRGPRDGEVLLTRGLAGRLHLLDGDRLRPGAAITLVDGTSARVAGLAVDPSCLSCEQAVAVPGSPIARAAASHSAPAGYAYRTENGDTTPYPTFLVDLPAGISEEALGRRLAAHGVALTTRSALAHRVRGPGSDSSLGAGALVALITAIGLLEVVLLAGAAFAVGARRQVRVLGLVAACGGSGRDIRRLVLAQGVVLSALGAGLGVATGAAVAVGGRVFWERLADTEIAGWAFSSEEIAAAALAGTASGLVAAIIPAIGASRMLPVDALAARFRGHVGSHRGRTLAGALMVAAGIVCGLLAHHMLVGDVAAYERALAAAAITGRDLSPPQPGGPVNLIIVGAVLALIGIALLTPQLIGWIAASGAYLPLSPRLAVRDAERHRHRTGPATSAIVVAVTGSVALACILAGSFHAGRLHDSPALPRQMLDIQRADGSTTAMVQAATRAVAQLPGGRQHTLSIPFVPGDRPIPGRPDTDADTLSVLRQDSSCPADLPAGVCSPIAIPPSGPLAIGGDDYTTRLVAGPGFSSEALHALENGVVLVFDATMLDHDGDVHIATPRGEVRLPGKLVPSTRTYRLLPSALISARTARAQDWAIGSGSELVTYSARASRDDVDAALSAATQAGVLAVKNSGPDKPENLVLGLLAAAAAFVTLVGVAVSVALSVAESRADLATLAAVGAQPGRRRALTASQALLIGGLGSTLGAGLGAWIAFTAQTTTGSPSFVVPWAVLATTALGVPLLAAVIAALSTRARLPMMRRAE